MGVAEPNNAVQIRTMSRKQKCDDQITLRVAGTLREALETEAMAQSRSLSALARKVLVDFAMARIVSRETGAAR